MKTGLDRLKPDMLSGSRIGLLSHYAAVNSRFRSSVDVLEDIPGLELVKLFGPQHGFSGETQDNMIEWEGYTHPRYGIPVYSLYGKTRKPDPSILEGIDCFLVDLQDVGARYYTYVYTMAYCMRECAKKGIPVTVLDRPNPLGSSIIEGKNLKKGYESFVGLYPIPVRHGLSIGELAKLFARIDSLPEPDVIRMEGWDGKGIPIDYPWVQPSPNIPTPEAALVYPGMCLLEATNLSEGRGTTRPFTVFGAPWINGAQLCDRLNGTPWIEGAVLRPHAFIPTFNKHAETMCYGGEIHVLDRSAFRPLRAALGILMESFKYYRTKWNGPPYEYEYKKMPVDILSGGPDIREAINATNAEKLFELASGNSIRFSEFAGDILLYERKFRS